MVFEDPHLIVLSKPAGLLSQGDSSGDPNVVDWLRERFGRPYVGLVHRLDRNTTGLMVVAKRTKAAERLTNALQAGELNRSYLTWLHGNLTLEARWTHWLLKDERTNTTRVVRAGTSGAKEASLVVSPQWHGSMSGRTNGSKGASQKNSGTPVTLASFVLETGRSHQIRIQSSAEGFPLVGDAKYGAPDTGFPRPALHSAKLSFPHPMGGALCEYEDPLPADMAALRKDAP